MWLVVLKPVEHLVEHAMVVRLVNQLVIWTIMELN